MVWSFTGTLNYRDFIIIQVNCYFVFRVFVVFITLLYLYRGLIDIVLVLPHFKINFEYGFRRRFHSLKCGFLLEKVRQRLYSVNISYKWFCNLVRLVLCANVVILKMVLWLKIFIPRVYIRLWYWRVLQRRRVWSTSYPK